MHNISIDIGGTFTDCVVTSQGKIVVATKSPSTPSEPADGVINVLGVAADLLRVSVEKLLENTALFIHGSTVATNAILERKGPRTALLTTRGHENTLLSGRVQQRVAGLSPADYIDEYRLSRADPIIDRNLIVGVSERTDVAGNIVVPLNEQAVLAQVERLVRDGVQSIAVCFLWSVINPAHEVRVRELIGRHYPNLYVAISSDVAPLMGEYERTVTTALTAYLGPKIKDYLDKLECRLKQLGFANELLLIQATGGLTPPRGLNASPLLFLDSGPVAGVLGGRHLARSYAEPNMILMDMGGTSLDAAVVYDGEVQIDEAPVISKYSYLIPKVDVRSIGAGGGSKIWVDSSGGLRCGPESAGANPGPACYDQGGTEPTTTDANVTLGLLDPDFFLGGRKKLNRQRSLDALASVGRAIGLQATEVAAGAFQIINAQMADLIRAVSIERGYDPREFALLSFGGAGSTHAAFIARDLKIDEVYVPRHAPVFCALGMQATEMLHGFQKSCPITLPASERELGHLNRVIEELEQRVIEQFRGEGIGNDQVTLQYLAYMKYSSQVHELTIRMPFKELDADRLQSLGRLFEREYEDTYGAGTAPDFAQIEIRRCRVEGRSSVDTIKFAAAKNIAGDAALSPPAPKGTREVTIPSVSGSLWSGPLLIYDGENMQPGQAVEGPCIIERIADTVVVPDRASATIDGNFTIRIDLQSVREEQIEQASVEHAGAP